MQQHKAKAGDILHPVLGRAHHDDPGRGHRACGAEAGGDVEKAAQALVASANAKGGEDNITVLL